MSEERTGLSPGAEERLRAVQQMARAKFNEWGPMRVMHGTALVLMVLGTVLPVATVAQFGFFGTATARIHFYDLGLGGWVTVLLGIVLAAAPFGLTLTRRTITVGFGLACWGFGVLVVPWLLSTYTGVVAQLTFGYYALALAFATMIVAYWRRMSEASDIPSSSPKFPTAASTEE